MKKAFHVCPYSLENVIERNRLEMIYRLITSINQTSEEGCPPYCYSAEYNLQ